MCVLPRAKVRPNHVDVFGELRGLPYYCSKEGEHPHQWGKVYAVRIHAPNR